MFEQYKLNKYNKKIIGFAYCCHKFEFVTKFKIYLVVKENDEYKFINFKKYMVDSNISAIYEEKRLLSQGYQPLPYYFDKNNKRDNTKSLNLRRIK